MIGHAYLLESLTERFQLGITNLKRIARVILNQLFGFRVSNVRVTHGIPNHPIAKNVLNTNINVAATTAAGLLLRPTTGSAAQAVAANRAMVDVIPKEPANNSFLLPNRSERYVRGLDQYKTWKKKQGEDKGFEVLANQWYTQQTNCKWNILCRYKPPEASKVQGRVPDNLRGV